MKSKEELNKLKEEVEAVNEKLAELTEEEIAQVTGGAIPTFDWNQREVWCSILEKDTTCKQPYLKGKKEQCEGCRLNV